jgi:hypothetical protein
MRLGRLGSKAGQGLEMVTVHHRPRNWRRYQSLYRAGHPPKFARWCTPNAAATSRSRARLAAKNRPNNRPVRSFSSRTRQLSALLPSRSKIPASSAEIAIFPLRKSRPVHLFRRRRRHTSQPRVAQRTLGAPSSRFSIHCRDGHWPFPSEWRSPRESDNTTAPRGFPLAMPESQYGVE